MLPYLLIQASLYKFIFLNYNLTETRNLCVCVCVFPLHFVFQYSVKCETRVLFMEQKNEICKLANTHTGKVYLKG